MPWRRNQPIPPLFQLVLKTAKESGQELLIKAIGTKAKSWQPMVKIPGTLKQEVRQALPQWTQKMSKWCKKISLHRELPRLKTEIESLALQTLSLAAFTSGTYVGSQIPNQNVKFTLRSNDRETVLVHSAARFIGEVSIDWLVLVLDRVLEQNVIEHDEKHRLEGIKQVFSRFGNGFEIGGVIRAQLLRRFSKRPWSFTFEMPVDADTFSLIQNLFHKREVVQNGQEILANENRT